MFCIFDCVKLGGVPISFLLVESRRFDMAVLSLLPRWVVTVWKFVCSLTSV